MGSVSLLLPPFLFREARITVFQAKQLNCDKEISFKKCFSAYGLWTIPQKPMAGKDEKHVLCLGLNFCYSKVCISAGKYLGICELKTVENHWPENIFPCFQKTSKTELAEHFSMVMLMPSLPTPILLMDHVVCSQNIAFHFLWSKPFLMRSFCIERSAWSFPRPTCTIIWCTANLNANEKLIWKKLRFSL